MIKLSVNKLNFCRSFCCPENCVFGGERGSNVWKKLQVRGLDETSVYLRHERSLTNQINTPHRAVKLLPKSVERRDWKHIFSSRKAFCAVLYSSSNEELLYSSDITDAIATDWSVTTVFGHASLEGWWEEFLSDLITLHVQLPHKVIWQQLNFKAGLKKQEIQTQI